jgi:hypothetical protein
LIVNNIQITITPASEPEITKEEKESYRTYINSGDYLLEKQMRNDEYKKIQ